MLYADQIKAETDGSLLLYLVMAKIATEIGCTEFRWKVSIRQNTEQYIARGSLSKDASF